VLFRSMIANVPERARRRRLELENAGIALEEEEIVKEIEERDMKDSTRNLSPLRMASGAVELDTSNLTIEEQVDFIVKRAERLVENVGRG
jgi:cytidylate kinase